MDAPAGEDRVAVKVGVVQMEKVNDRAFHSKLKRHLLKHPGPFRGAPNRL